MDESGRGRGMSSAKMSYPCAPSDVFESRIVTFYIVLLVRGFSRYACIQFCFWSVKAFFFSKNIIYLDYAGNIITATISIPYLQINRVNVIIWHVILLTYKEDNSIIIIIMKVYTFDLPIENHSVELGICASSWKISASRFEIHIISS